jgi:hypothetical protein
MWTVIPKKEKIPILKKSLNLSPASSEKANAINAASEKRIKASVRGGITSRLIFRRGRVMPQINAVRVRAKNGSSFLSIPK